jgi:hypothetical protein
LVENGGELGGYRQEGRDQDLRCSQASDGARPLKTYVLKLAQMIHTYDNLLTNCVQDYDVAIKSAIKFPFLTIFSIFYYSVLGMTRRISAKTSFILGRKPVLYFKYLFLAGVDVMITIFCDF